MHHYHGSPRRGPFGWAVKFLFSLGVICGALILGIVVGFYTATLSTLLKPRPSVTSSTYREGTSERKIGIVPIEGMIDQNTAMFVHDAVDHVIDDTNIAAVVIYVESGGGMVGPSEQIWHEFQRLRQARPNLPIVASYGSLAASGGYYVSCDADYIIAQPTCITGSIGVMAQVLTLETLMEDKLGIQPVTMTSSEATQKDVANDIFRSWNEQDKAKLQKILDAMHERFVEVVRMGRVQRTGAMTDNDLSQVTTGVAMMVDEALEAKLVDQIGYLEDALDKAEQLAGLVDPPAELFTWPTPGLLQMMAGASQRGMAARPGWMPQNAAELRKLVAELGTPQMMFLYQP